MATIPISVAIIGGGLAGATIANALHELPHIQLKLFESAPQFSERGAAVILTNTSQKGLERVSSNYSDILHKAGAVSMNSTRLVIVS